MDDIELTIQRDLSVRIRFLNTDSIAYMTLMDVIEKYTKNNKVCIKDIILEKENLTSTEQNLIDILKGGNNEQNNIFEAQILIPYRARGSNQFRKEQLHKFLKHMNNYLSNVHPRIKYKLIIIEQNNDHMFNRGLLLNIGYLEREKIIDYKIKYYVHHNCDLFPSISQAPPLDYSFTPINEVRDIFGYYSGIGGIAVFNRLTFKKINGFPNDYFNWGAEDTTLYKRCEINSIHIKRPLYNTGINEESHARDSSFNSINQKKGENDNHETNGLTTCKYTCNIDEYSDFKYPNVIHYLADFDQN
jgi:hypothetical protein